MLVCYYKLVDSFVESSVDVSICDFTTHSLLRNQVAQRQTELLLWFKTVSPFEVLPDFVTSAVDWILSLLLYSRVLENADQIA